MRGLLGHGWLWLLLFSVVLVVRWLADDPTALLVTNDSPEYLWMSEQNLLDGDMLRGYRTWGYPVFLKLVRLVSPDCAWVPALQLGLHVAGVLVLYAGLRAVGFPTLAAVLVCLPVLLADSVYDQHTTQYLMTDSLANSVLLTAVGVFFLLLARPAQAWRWLALTLLVFAAYQMRPAYQSLVAVVPVSGWLLRSYVPRPRAFVLGLVLISWAPLLAFCGVRYHATGNFALVSFTGTNLSGIAGNLLREDMVPALRSENRPLAQALLAGQARPGLRWHVFVHWRPPLPSGYGGVEDR